MNTVDMTTFPWTVVLLEVAFATAVLVLSANAMWTRKPGRKQRSARA